MGTACFVGQLAASSAFIGVDSAAHMSEEVSDNRETTLTMRKKMLTAFQVKNASLTVPRMMMGTTALNGILGLTSIITYMFVIQDIQQQILESSAAYPWVAVFALATGSNAGAIGMTIPFIVISFGELQASTDTFPSVDAYISQA